MTTRIGLIAQPHATGIGIQTWEFARHMNPDKVLLTDLSKIHAASGKKVEVTDYFDGFKTRTTEVPTADDVNWLCDDIDLIFVVETPLNYEVFDIAQQRGVKTVLQYNYEFLDYLNRKYLPKPDLFLCPSQAAMIRGAKYLPVPVATDRFKGEVKKSAERFIHVAGHKTHMDRNGTEIVRKVFYQSSLKWDVISQENGTKVKNYWDLYDDADVLVIPRRYGYLSLQIQEAMATGMVVVTTDHDPYYTDEHSTVSVRSNKGGILRARTTIQTWDADAQELGRVLNQMASNPQQIRDMSELSLHKTAERSWKKMAPIYMQEFEVLCS